MTRSLADKTGFLLPDLFGVPSIVQATLPPEAQVMIVHADGISVLWANDGAARQMGFAHLGALIRQGLPTNTPAIARLQHIAQTGSAAPEGQLERLFIPGMLGEGTVLARCHSLKTSAGEKAVLVHLLDISENQAMQPERAGAAQASPATGPLAPPLPGPADNPHLAGLSEAPDPKMARRFSFTLNTTGHVKEWVTRFPAPAQHAPMPPSGVELAQWVARFDPAAARALAERIAKAVPITDFRLNWPLGEQGHAVALDLFARPLAGQSGDYVGFGLLGETVSLDAAALETLPDKTTGKAAEKPQDTARSIQILPAYIFPPHLLPAQKAATSPAIAQDQPSVQDALPARESPLRYNVSATTVTTGGVGYTAPAAIRDQAGRLTTPQPAHAANALSPSALSPSGLLQGANSATGDPAPPRLEGAEPASPSKISTAQETAQAETTPPSDRPSDRHGAPPSHAHNKKETDKPPDARAVERQEKAREEKESPAPVQKPVPAPVSLPVAAHTAPPKADPPAPIPVKPSARTPVLSATEQVAFSTIAQVLTKTTPAPMPAQGLKEQVVQINKQETHKVAPAPSAAIPALDTNKDSLSSVLRFLDALPFGAIALRGDHVVFANRAGLHLAGYSVPDAFLKEKGLAVLLGNRPLPPPGARTLLRLTPKGSAPFEGVLHRLVLPVAGHALHIVLFYPSEEAALQTKLDQATHNLATLYEESGELRMLLDTASDGVITLDVEGRILTLNGSAEALLGYNSSEVVGKSVSVLFQKDSQTEVLDALDVAKGNGLRALLNDGREVIGREKKGGIVPLFMTVSRIREASPMRFGLVLRDLTARKQAELEMLAARQRAEEASAKKSTFLARITHEIRTPMNAIIGFSEVMAEERLGPIGTEKYKEYLEDIRASGRHVISLVNDLLDLAKIESGRVDLDFAAVHLNSILTGCIAMIQPQANTNRVLIRTQLAHNLPPVVADERAMRQIMLNLLSNATRFTEPGGQVIASTVQTELGEVVLRIRDTGVGMSEEEIIRALEPFQQVGQYRTGDGTGLGLPLTKALAEANRAHFAIRSHPGDGTMVEITFPPPRVLAQ